MNTAAFDHLVNANYDLSKAAHLDHRLARVRVNCDDGSVVTLEHVLEWIAVVGSRLEQEVVSGERRISGRDPGTKSDAPTDNSRHVDTDK